MADVKVKINDILRGRRFWVVAGTIIFIIHAFVFRPIFNLHLTGDDYVTIGLVEKYLRTHPPGIRTYLNYIFSDWGVQDMLAYGFYLWTGFNPTARYLFSFTVRFLASLSFLPLLYLMTKDKTASLLSALFFSVMVIGIQTTDWVVASTVYVAIIFLNIFLYMYFEYRRLKTKRLAIPALFLFMITIIIQPTRMIFLPGFIILSEAYLMYTERKIHSGWIRPVMILLSFIFLVVTTNIGNSITKGSSVHWIEDASIELNIFNNRYFSRFVGSVGEGDPEVFISPVRQLGIMLNPLYETYKTSGSPAFVMGLLFLLFVLWTYLKASGQKKAFLMIFLMLVFVSMSLFWLKNPLFELPVHHRYLIVPGSVLAVILGIAVSTDKSRLIAGAVAILITLNAVSSYSYLKHAENIRSFKTTQKIRDSLRTVESLNDPQALTLYYFQPEGSEVLDQALLWGFNYIHYYHNNLDYLWNFAATDSFDSAVSAVSDGHFFSLFEIRERPVGIENVHSFRLQGDSLVETTDETRTELVRYQK